MRHRVELFWALARREVLHRYVDTRLGWAWLLLQPLLLVLFYTFVVSKVFGVRAGEGTESYALFVLGGLLPWVAFSEAVVRAGSSLQGHAAVVTKVLFPVELLPAAAVAASLLGLAMTLALTVLGISLGLGQCSASLVCLPLLWLLLGITALGIGSLLAVLNAWVRDVTQVMGFAMNLWLFATPVLYSRQMVPADLRWVIAFNPVTPLFESFREVLIYGRWPSAGSLVFAAIAAAGALLVGGGLFLRAKRAYAELL